MICSILNSTPHEVLASIAMNKAYLLLEDGTQLEGRSFGAEGTAFGELVFNTGMTGYQEILTDPSYAGQVVVMTYPLIGNYGMNEDDNESQAIHVNGFVVREACDAESNWKSTSSLSEHLKQQGIVALAGVDTRMLTKKIRSQGAMLCVITTAPVTAGLRAELQAYRFPVDVVQQVSRTALTQLPGSGKRIGILDFGVKLGIAKHLSQLGCHVEIYPWDTPAQVLLKAGLDAVLFSNGPGDPKDVQPAIQTAQQLIEKIPIFGICLGCQILALALGGDTYKLKFGHRGSNHPVIDIRTHRVMMTAQNHGYAVVQDSLPPGAILTHQNVNDGTVEGFAFPAKNIYTVQFHPEAGPGPRDASPIFAEWLALLETGAACHA